MKTALAAFIRKHKTPAAVAGFIVCIVAFAIAWDASASIRGRIHARFDIARGRYKVLGYGLPPVWRDEYARLLKDRYGIEYQQAALCIVSHSLVAYVNAYDEVSEEAANRKFGHNVFEETAEDALRTWEHRTDKQRLRSVVEELFSYSPEKTQDIKCFRSLASGVSMREIVQRCGRPDEDAGSGDYLFIYRLPDRSTVSIRTPYLKRVEQAIYTDPSGKQSPLLLPRQ